VNIINIGGWYVGNTAILDWMDGFDEIGFVKDDFNIARVENGVMDIIAEQDLSKKIKIIKKQKHACYFGFYRVLRMFVGRYTKHLTKKNKLYPYNSTIAFYRRLHSFLNSYEYLLKTSEAFDEIELCKSWLNAEALSLLENKNNHSIVYQNPFFYDETFSGHAKIWPKLFDPYKLIFVHRDPLDQFSDIVNSGDHLLSSWPRFHGETESMHPADRFLTIARKLYKARLRMAEEYNSDQLLIFSFEDFLVNHDKVTPVLKGFLNINSERSFSNKRFIKEKSLKNIGKGLANKEALQLLEGKSYVLDELNILRKELSALPQSSCFGNGRS